MYQVSRIPQQAYINGGKTIVNTFNNLNEAKMFFSFICDTMGYHYEMGENEAGGRGHDYLIQINEI
jgi:hypothetical protein